MTQRFINRLKPRNQADKGKTFFLICSEICRTSFKGSELVYGVMFSFMIMDSKAKNKKFYRVTKALKGSQGPNGYQKFLKDCKGFQMLVKAFKDW